MRIPSFGFIRACPAVRLRQNVAGTILQRNQHATQDYRLGRVYAVKTCQDLPRTPQVDTEHRQHRDASAGKHLHQIPPVEK